MNPGQRAASALRPLLVLLATASSVFLAGCPQQQAVSVATKPPANATAPNLPKTLGGDNAVTAQQAGNPRVASLIVQVDKSYKSGVQNYRNNRLDAARIDFDFAVDLMLSSGIDIKQDAALNDEFERTVDAVNALEMVALKQGNGFSPPVEESPIDVANELTFKTSPELTASLKGTLNVQSDLPLVINDEVAGYINAYANSTSFKAHMAASLRRASKYQALIQKVLKDEGVPQDLIYLAVAESGFQLQVVNSSSGAGGMWQFMPYQGAYGLARNGYFDERFDPEKSSRAYARYIKGLYNQFGDWYLAMAGYDWGPGNIQKAVMRTGYADYWELYRRNAMPRETKNYVPQILAAIIMAKNPEKYGLNRFTPDPPLQYDTVPVSYAMDLRLAADVTGTTLANLVSLNPALLRLSTPRDITYDLHLPAGTSKQFNDRMAAIPEAKRASWRFHEVVAGETLPQIAQLFHVGAPDILAANDLPTESAVEEGDELVIPVVGVNGSGFHPLQYTTRSGDTLVTVADRFDVTTEDLRQWNHLSSSILPARRKIYVAEPVRLAPAGRGRRHAGRVAVTRGGRGRGAARGAAATRGRGRAAPVARGRATSHGRVTAGRSTVKTTRASAGGRPATHVAAAKKRRR
ncbi:MAG: LysM peptidoglycan-binding domain-containing protein [Janthinobacterium lividum]